MDPATSCSEVKKAKKWSCKICGEKQSVKQVFFTGTGKDCRVQVQTLNVQQKKNSSQVEQSVTVFQNTPLENGNYDVACSREKYGDSGSRWANFIEKQEDYEDDSEEDNMHITMDREAIKESKWTKRQRSRWTNRDENKPYGQLPLKQTKTPKTYENSPSVASTDTKKSTRIQQNNQKVAPQDTSSSKWGQFLTPITHNDDSDDADND